MRNPKVLKTRPEFYKTWIYLEDSLLILTNIQTWVNYRLYSQDLANLVQENIGFNFKTVYQMFRFWTRFLPESRKCWRVFLIILCLILYGAKMGLPGHYPINVWGTTPSLYPQLPWIVRVNCNHNYPECSLVIGCHRFLASDWSARGS